MYPENLPQHKPPHKDQRQFSQVTSIPHQAINNMSQPKMVFIPQETPKTLQYPWDKAYRYQNGIESSYILQFKKEKQNES